MKRTLHILIPGLALLAALGASPARAALGEAESSVASDREKLAAVARETTTPGPYTVHALAQGTTTIREYVSPQGVVFAVTWEGLANPDLGTLLGSYAGEYEQAARAARQANQVKGRRAQRVAGAHVVVDRWGHMRDRHGRAYLPDLVPQGVTLDEIR